MTKSHQLSVRLSKEVYDLLTASGKGPSSAIEPILQSYFLYGRFADVVLQSLVKRWKKNRGGAISVESIPQFHELSFASPGGLYRVLAMLDDRKAIIWSSLQIPVTAEGAQQLSEEITGKRDILCVTAVKPGPALWEQLTP
jgi:hypothetical protein